MNLKEQLAAKKDEVLALKERIEAGDETAIKRAGELKTEIEDLESRVKAADDATALLKRVGSPAKGSGSKAGMFADMGLKDLKANRGTKSTTIFVKTNTNVQTAPTITDYDRNVVDVQLPLGLRDLMGSEQIAGNALSYLVMGTTEVPAGGAPAIVEEGAAKPQYHTPTSPVTDSLDKIAAFFKETDELLEDAPFLESALRSRGLYLHQLKIENYLASSILGTSGIQAITTGISFDNLLTAKGLVRSATGFAPDAIVLNPADYTALQLTKDSNNGQYLMGGPGYVPYGNGRYEENVPIWGLRVVQSSGVPSGTALVGAFRVASSVVTKRGAGVRVEVSNSNEDDFIHNLVTVRIEERLMSAVRFPAAFVKVYTA